MRDVRLSIGFRGVSGVVEYRLVDWDSRLCDFTLIVPRDMLLGIFVVYWW